MAIIRCPECKKKISDQATICVHCGYSFDKTQTPVNAKAASSQKNNTQKSKALLLGSTIGCFIMVTILVLYFVVMPFLKYNKAVDFMETAQYQNAIDAFESLGDYKDSISKIIECKYRYATTLMETHQFQEAITSFKELDSYKDSEEKIDLCRLGIQYDEIEELAKEYPAKAAIAFAKMGNFLDATERSRKLWNQIAVRKTLSAGYSHTVFLKADGNLLAVGDNTFKQCEVSNWDNIITAIAAIGDYTIGLKADGTVISTGFNNYEQCNVSDWTDIVAIDATVHTVGLKADGTVVSTGSNEYGQCNVSGWTDIVAISAGMYHTIGLKADGTVVSTGSNEYGQCNVNGWTDIVAISAGSFHTVGLKIDGTLVAQGMSDTRACDVHNWTGIIAIDATKDYTVGLKSNGTVVFTGDNTENNNFIKSSVTQWTDIVAISAGYDHIVGLKADGTVVSTGSNKYGQCNVANISNVATKSTTAPNP